MIKSTPMSQILDIVKVGMTAYGVGYIILGITWIALPTQSRVSGIGWTGWLTPGIVGTAFVIAGTIGASVAILPIRSPRATQLAWLVLTAMPVVLSLYFLVAWIWYLIPTVASGSERGIASAVSYLIIACGAAGMSRVSQIAHRLQDKWEGV